MKRRSLTFLFVALLVSLPLAVAVLARSEPPTAVQPTDAVSQPATTIDASPNDGACAMSQEPVTSQDQAGSQGPPVLQGECAPVTCTANCSQGSCSIGPCDEGLKAKCVCRPGGIPMCGCVAC